MAHPGGGDADKAGAHKEEPAAPLIADATSTQLLLQAAGCDDYEPRVVNLLVDFLHSYTTSVLLDAEAYSEVTPKQPGCHGTVAMDDVMLAIQSRSVYSFVAPPPSTVLEEAAKEINKVDIPRFPNARHGLLIPTDERDCLTAQNYQLSLDSAGNNAEG